MANEKLNLIGQSEDASSRIITDEEKAQLLGDFKETQSAEMEKSAEQATQDLRRQKPVTLTREQATEEAREKGEPLPRFRPSTKASDRLALPTTLPDHGLPELYTPAERILEKASKITGLAPESPHTQMIAQRMAKGDPFSSQALEDAKFETMKLVRAGVIPNPYYKGWTGKVEMAYDYAAPAIVEIGLPITAAIVASPMLVAPAPGSRVGYFALLGGSSSGGNAIAQNMRIASGLQRSWSWQENLAAGAWGTVPGVGNAKNLSKTATVALRATQGSVMAGGENLTKQGLEILSGDRQEVNFKETGFATGMGLVIGGILGRIEKALIKYEPREQAAPLLRKALRENLAEAKRQVKVAERQGGVLTEARKRIEKIEKQLEELAPAEDKALQKVIDELDQVEKKQVEAFELYAKEFSESKAQQVLKQSDQGGVPTAAKAAEVDDAPTPPKTPDGDVVSQKFKDFNEADNPEWMGASFTPHYKNVPVGEKGHQSVAYMNEKGEIIDLSADAPIQIDKTLSKLDDAALEEKLRVTKNERDDLEGWEDEATIERGHYEKILELRTKVEGLELEQWRRDVEWRAEDLVKDPEAVDDPFNDLFGKVWDEVKIDNDMSNVKVGMAFEAIKKHGLTDKFKTFLERQRRALGTQVEETDADFLFQNQMEKAVNAYKQFSKPKQKAGLSIEAYAPTPPKTAEPDAPTSSTKDKARQILEDFKEGKGTRDVDADADDPIKARLLTDDPEKQRLINAMQDAIREDLENIKGDRVSKQQYMARVQAEISRRLGAEAGAEFGLVISRSQMSDNVKVADALDELSIHMSANGLVMVKQMDDVLVKLDDVDVNNLDSVNDGVVELMRVIPALMGWKKTGSAAGRLLQSRQIVKDQFDIKLEKLEKALEKNLVKDLKLARNLTPEQRDAQLKTFGDLEVVNKLLTVAKEAKDIKELRDVLVKQQQAFQNRSTVKQFMDGTTASLYTKVRDIAIDVAYSGMLSAPTTWMKVAIGNTLMKTYNAGSGYVGAKYMAMAPWARKGMSKAEFEEAAQFWKTAGTSFFEFSEIANIEARKAFRTGDSDVRSHFERVGQSAMSMERTGLSGVFGQTVENLGQVVDVPGKMIAATDATSRIRLAHAMTKAKAEYDWNLARQRGEEVPEVFEDYYQGFLRKVFNEDKNRLMTEDAVRKQAIMMAEKEGVKAENLAKYVEHYVKKNWDKDTSAFVNYVDRNTKEVTFTEEIGEFAQGNWLERVPIKKLENLIKSSPVANVLLNPFMRTGRNIIREGLGTSAVLADIPGLRRYTNGIWTKTTQDLNSKDPIVVARAKGKQIVASGVLMTFWGLASSEGDVKYVGKQDQNWKKNQNIETGTGLGEYELRIPDGKGGVMGIDLSAVEPLATVGNIVADCVTLSRGTPAQQEEAHNAMTIVALTVANNIGNKSYYKQFGRFMDIMTMTDETSENFQDKLFRFTKGTAGSFIPFSSASNTVARASDDFSRRGDTFLQILGKRISGFAKTVPPRRDSFGDPMPEHSSKGDQATRPFNPFPISRQIMKRDDYVKTDKEGFRRINITTSKKSPRIKADGAKYVNIKNEEEVRNAAHAILLELNAEFNFNGGTAVKDGVDLREVVHKETRQDAFDRWQEIYSLQKIEGKTVKQAVVLAMSGAASRISNVAGDQGEGVTVDDPRLGLVQNILTTYRNASYAQLNKEYPILKEVKRDNLIRKQKFYQGKPSEAFDSNATPLEEYKANQPNTRLEQLMIPFAD